MAKELSAGAVIFRKEGKNIFYLLLDYGNNYWGFPKGIARKNESLEKAAQREIFEETGLDVKDIKFILGFKETVKYVFKRKDNLIFKAAIYFLVKTDKKRIAISKEHYGYNWLLFREARKLINFEQHRQVLKKAHCFLKKKEPL